MDNQKNQLLLLISVGLMIIALTQIIWHYAEISDLYTGVFMGAGIGSMLTALLITRKKQRA